ncbi:MULTISPECIES: sulfotransferase domain-containing protein [Nitrosomonas]|uniref:Sulfotransferase domain-containing protein n=1 Tax=Nitrosomonas communis TaxID=44574 RepID=A0A0F7KBQ9_9PROT|nr:MULTISPECIES: sulfotransferase domain-containing protein [Nitrosomonas]AKH37036.1 hypothetical protein AAW31_03170 [Nitrosomonas communis]UVS62180.1 sulfotransferase [Nitrosomonas sp. PLL12]
MIDYKKIFNAKLAPCGNFQDCYAFSIHKAGSSLMHKMIGEVCHSAGIPSISIPDTLFNEGIFDKDWQNDERLLDFFIPGKIFYGFRYLPEILLNESLRLREKKSVLLIRDPRDALVSQYFSFGGKNVSHKLPSKNQDTFLKEAQATSHLNIDQYVLQAAEIYLDKLNKYKENLNFENVKLFKYEEIYFDKRKFLDNIFAHFGIPVESRLLDEVAEKMMFVRKWKTWQNIFGKDRQAIMWTN